jgi:hypothetical protein
VAAGAQFMEFYPGSPSGWQIAGLTATVLVFIGAVYSGIADDCAPQQLEIARKAIEEASKREAAAEKSENVYGLYVAETRRAVHLYLSMVAMRGILERLPDGDGEADHRLADSILQSIHQYLPTAAGFEPWHQWTFGIYKAQETADGVKLVCVAKRRAIECNLADARHWPAGKGVLGVAYTNREEVIIEDASVSSIRTVFALGESARKHDGDRYKSFAAVPVLEGNENACWGVVIGTNDQIDHFRNGEEYGVQTAELVRAVASMMALGVRMINDREGAGS